MPCRIPTPTSQPSGSQSCWTSCGADRFGPNYPSDRSMYARAQTGAGPESSLKIVDMPQSNKDCGDRVRFATGPLRIFNFENATMKTYKSLAAAALTTFALSTAGTALATTKAEI